MSNQLKKRILTSLLILPLVLLVIYFSETILILFLILIYGLCYYEINKISYTFIFKLFSNLFLIASFSLFYYLRGDTHISLFLTYWILFLTIFSDVGGYIIGKIFKGKKLTSISPNKTYSGSIGSFVFSILSLPLINLMQIILINEILINFLQLKYFYITIFLSFVSQCGDIYVSYWKRKFHIKDTSNLLPGHGGILDRIDGLIFVVVVFAMLKFQFDIV